MSLYILPILLNTSVVLFLANTIGVSLLPVARRIMKLLVSKHASNVILRGRLAPHKSKVIFWDDSVDSGFILSSDIDEVSLRASSVDVTRLEVATDSVGAAFLFQAVGFILSSKI